MSFRFIEDHRDAYPVRLMWCVPPTAVTTCRSHRT